MKRIHWLRVEGAPGEYAALFEGAAGMGVRLGWLRLDPPGAVDGELEEAAGLGALRAVAAGGGRVATVKPVRGRPVLGDLAREHFRGCLAVLIRGEVGAPCLRPDGGGWLVETEAGRRRFDTESLLAALRSPRPFGGAAGDPRQGDRHAKLTGVMQPVRFFLPGPSYVPPDLLEALGRQPVGHRSAAFRSLYRSLEPRLRQVFRTEGDVCLATSSATLLMESAVLSTVAEELLVVVCGAFSERWHAIATAIGRRADRLEVPWGSAVAPDLLRAALRRKRYEAVTLTHNETSTGVVNPLAELAAVVREESDALVLVDAVSSLGGAPVETDGWDLDVVLTGSQKALALPPGLALFALSERAAGRAAKVAHRGFYTDLLRYRDQHRDGGTITTPAVCLVYALDRQLDRVLTEGMERRWERHRRLRDQVAAWAEDSGFEVVPPADARSWTVSCLRPPAGIEAPALVAALAEDGWTVGSGYGKWKPSTLRIGHMGEIREADLAALLEAVAELSRERRTTPA